VAWLVVGIIWLWGTMLMATFYPLIDGGIEQISQVYRGLFGKKGSNDNVIHYAGSSVIQSAKDETTAGSSSAASTVGEVNHASNFVADSEKIGN
jgi:hypothetical protein